MEQTLLKEKIQKHINTRLKTVFQPRIFDLIIKLLWGILLHIYPDSSFPDGS